MNHDKTSRPASRFRKFDRWLKVVANTLIFMITIFIVVPLAASLLAKLHWGLDLLAQFYVQYLLVLVAGMLICLLARKWKSLVLLSVAAVVALIPIAPYYLPSDFLTPSASVVGTPPPGSTNKRLRLVSFNVLASNQRGADTVDFLLAENPDIVVLYEISPRWKVDLEPLGERFPHVRFETREDNFGVCIFSRIPWTDLEIIETGPNALPSVSAKFSLNGNSFHLIGTHPLPPAGARNSQSRNAQLVAVAGALDLSAGRILAGDFNLTPFSPWFREVRTLAAVEDSALGFGINPTWYAFPGPFGGIKIDHVLVSPNIRVIDHRVGPDLGSDHRPLIVDLEFKT